jgi:hypothetical protein
MQPILAMNPSSQTEFDIFVYSDYAIVITTNEEQNFEEE